MPRLVRVSLLNVVGGLNLSVERITDGCPQGLAVWQPTQPMAASSRAAPSSPSTSLVGALTACFEADPLIDEYDFVPLLADPTDPTDAAAAASSFFVESHKLAISAAAVKPLFREAHAAFQRQQQQQQQQLTTSDPSISPTDLIDATRALLLVNPDVYTAWNARKRLVVAGVLSPASELAFVDLVFSKHTKKACAWAHRRWCLARLLAAADLNIEEEAAQREEHELEVTAAVAERFPKNYYAWTHRWWVVETGAERRRRRQRVNPEAAAEASSSSSNDDGDDAVTSWLGAQVAFGEAWVQRHVWDMSAVSFLHHALEAWVRAHEGEGEGEGGACCALRRRRLVGMLGDGARRLDQCPGHESLWCQRRGLLALLLRLLLLQQQQKQQRPRSAPPSLLLTLPLPPPLAPPSPSPPYPPPLLLDDDDGAVGQLLSWELGMAAYYLAGQGPHFTEEGAGLLWEEAARRRQRVSAWAHARWVLELARRSGVGVENEAEWGRWLVQGLKGLSNGGEQATKLSFLSPGYSKLVQQLM